MASVLCRRARESVQTGILYGPPRITGKDHDMTIYEDGLVANRANYAPLTPTDFLERAATSGLVDGSSHGIRYHVRLHDDVALFVPCGPPHRLDQR